MPFRKRIILRLGSKQRGQRVQALVGIHCFFQALEHFIKPDHRIIRRAQGRSDSRVAVAVSRKHSVFLIQLQRFHKALAQPLQEMQRAAEKHNLACQLPALGQSRDRLIHHSLKNGSRNVLFTSALIQNRLDIAFGKYTAAGGDGIELRVLQRQGIQFIHRHI